MKYETPELAPLSPAIYPIQGGKPGGYYIENLLTDNEVISAYEDWE